MKIIETMDSVSNVTRCDTTNKKQSEFDKIEANDHIRWRRRRKRKHLEGERVGREEMTVSSSSTASGVGKVNEECSKTNNLTYCDLNERSSINLQLNNNIDDRTSERLAVHEEEDDDDVISVNHQSPTTTNETTTTIVRFRGLATTTKKPNEDNFKLIKLIVNSEKKREARRTTKIINQSTIGSEQISNMLARNQLNYVNRQYQQQHLRPKQQLESSPARCCCKVSTQINLLPNPKFVSLVLTMLVTILLTTTTLKLSVNCHQSVQNEDNNSNNNRRQQQQGEVEFVNPQKDLSHSGDVVKLTPLVRGQHEYISSEQDLLVQLLQSTGSVEDANQLLDTLIKDNLNNQADLADYSQVKPSFDASPSSSSTSSSLIQQPLLAIRTTDFFANETNIEPKMKVLAPDPLNISDISLINSKHLENETRGRVGLLDEIIEASARGSKNVNFNVFYDDEQQASNGTSSSDEQLKLSLHPNRAAELYKTSKQIENLLNPPKPGSHQIPFQVQETKIRDSSSKQVAQASGGKKNINISIDGNDEDGLHNNESISSLIIKAGDHASRRLIANYSHFINHERIVPMATRQKLERQQLGAIRLLEAPSSLTTTTTTAATATATARLGAQDVETLNNESSITQSFADMNIVTASKPSFTTPEPNFTSKEHMIQSERFLAQNGLREGVIKQATNGSKSQQTSVINNLDNENERLRVNKKNESGVHKIVFVNSMPQWAAAKTKPPNYMQINTNNYKEIQENGSKQTTKAVSKTSRMTPPPTSKPTTNISTESYLEVSVFADTFKPTTIAPTEIPTSTTIKPTPSVPDNAQDLSYSIETYETSTTSRKSTTSVPVKPLRDKLKQRNPHHNNKKNKPNSSTTLAKQAKKSNKRGDLPRNFNLNPANQQSSRKSKSTITLATTTSTTTSTTTTTAPTVPDSTTESTITTTIGTSPTDPTTMLEAQENEPATSSPTTPAQEYEKNDEEEMPTTRRTAKSLNLAHLLLGIGGFSERIPAITTKAYEGNTPQPSMNNLEATADTYDRQNIRFSKNTQYRAPTTVSQTTPYIEIQETMPVTNDFIPPTPDSLLPSPSGGVETSDDGKLDKWRAIELPLHAHLAQSKPKKSLIQNRTKQILNNETAINSNRNNKRDGINSNSGDIQNLRLSISKETDQKQQFDVNSEKTSKFDEDNGKEKVKVKESESSVLLDLNRLILNNANNIIRRSTVTTSTNSPILEESTDYSQTQMVLPTTSPLPDLSQAKLPTLDLQITTPGLSQTLPALVSTKAAAMMISTTARPLIVSSSTKSKTYPKAQSIDSSSPLLLENGNFFDSSTSLIGHNRAPSGGKQQQKLVAKDVQEQKALFEHQFRLGQYNSNLHQQARSNFNSTKIKLIDQPTSVLLLNNSGNNAHDYYNRSHYPGNHSSGHFGFRLVDQANEAIGGASGRHLDIGSPSSISLSGNRENNSNGNGRNSNKRRKFSTPTQTTSGRQSGALLTSTKLTSSPLSSTSQKTNNPLTNEPPFSIITQNRSSAFDLIRPHHLGSNEKPVHILRLHQGSPVSSKRGLHKINITPSNGEDSSSGAKSVFTDADAVTSSLAELNNKRQLIKGNYVGKNSSENQSEIATTTTTTTTIPATSSTVQTITIMDDATTYTSTTVNPIRDGTYVEPDSPIRSPTKRPDEMVAASTLSYMLDIIDGATATTPLPASTIAPEPTSTAAAAITTTKLASDDPLPSILFHNRLSSIFQYKMTNRTATKANNEANPNINMNNTQLVSSEQNAPLSLALYPFVGYRTKEPSTAGGVVMRQKEVEGENVTLASSSLPSNGSTKMTTSPEPTTDVLKFLQLNSDQAKKSTQQHQAHSNADSESSSETGQLNLGFYGDFYKNIDTRNSSTVGSNGKGVLLEYKMASYKRPNNASRLFRRERHKPTLTPSAANSGSDSVVTISPTLPALFVSSSNQDSFTDSAQKGHLKSGYNGTTTAGKVKFSNDNGLSEAYQQQQQQWRNKFKGEDQHNNRERSNNSIVNVNSENKLTHKNDNYKFSISSGQHEDGQIEGAGEGSSTLTNFSPLATNKQQQQRGSRFNEALSRYSTGSRDRSELPVFANSLGSGSNENINIDNNKYSNFSGNQSEWSNKSADLVENNMKVYVKLLAKDQQKMRDEVKVTMASRWTPGQFKARHQNNGSNSQKKRRRDPPVLPPIDDIQTTTSTELYPPSSSSSSSSSTTSNKHNGQTMQGNELQMNSESSFNLDLPSSNLNRTTFGSTPEVGFRPKVSLGNLFKRLPATQSQSEESSLVSSTTELPIINLDQLEQQHSGDDKDILRQFYDENINQKKRRELKQNSTSEFSIIISSQRSSLDSDRLNDQKSIFESPRKSQERPYSSLVQPFTEEEFPESMLVNDSQNERSPSSLSPLVGEYKTKSLLKTMINLGVPSGSNNAQVNNGNNLRKGLNEQVRLVKIDKFNMRNPSQQQVESVILPTTDIPIATSTQHYSPTSTEFIPSSTVPSTTTSTTTPSSTTSSTSTTTTVATSGLPSIGHQLSSIASTGVQSRWRSNGEAQLKPISFERKAINKPSLTTTSPLDAQQTTTLNSVTYSTPSAPFRPTFPTIDTNQPPINTITATTEATQPPPTTSTAAATETLLASTPTFMPTTTITAANQQYPYAHYTAPKITPYTTTTPPASPTNLSPFLNSNNNNNGNQQTFGSQTDPIRVILATQDENQRRRETSFGSSNVDPMQTLADNLNRHTSSYQKSRVFNKNTQQNGSVQLVVSSSAAPPIIRTGAYDEGSADSSFNLADFQQPPSTGMPMNPQVFEASTTTTMATLPATGSSDLEQENFGYFNSTNYKPPLNYETTNEEQTVIKPFGIRPSNQQRNQRHSSSYPGQGFNVDLNGTGIVNATHQQSQEFNQLSSFQRIAILTIGICCSLIVLCLLIIAISIKCRSSFEHPTSGSSSHAKSLALRRKRDEQQRRQLEKRRNFIGSRTAKVAKANNVSAGKRLSKIKGKSSSKNNLLLAAEFSTDGQVCSSAESTTTSACVSSSSEGADFMHTPQFQQQQQIGGVNIKSNNLKVKNKKMDGSLQNRANGFGKPNDNYQSNINGIVSENGAPNLRHMNSKRNVTEPLDQSLGSSLRKKMSGTITSRFLRMHLPRLLPYFAFDYAAREQHQQQVNSFLHQQQRITANIGHQERGSTSKDNYRLNFGELFNVGTGKQQQQQVTRDIPPIKIDRQLNQQLNFQKNMMFSGIEHPIVMNHHHQPISGQNFHMIRPTTITNNPIAINPGLIDLKTPKFQNASQMSYGGNVSLKQQVANSIQGNHIPEIKARKLLMKKNQQAANNTNRSSQSCAQCGSCSGSTWLFKDTGLASNFSGHPAVASCGHHQLAQCSNNQYGGAAASNNNAGLTGVTSRGKLPFGTASSVLCQPGQSNSTHHHIDTFNHTTNQLNQVPLSQTNKQLNRLKVTECQQDNISVHQSQMDNEHHLLIDNAMSSSQQANYFDRTTTQKHHNCNQYQTEQVGQNPIKRLVYEENEMVEEKSSHGSDNDKMVNLKRQQQVIPRGAFCGITATHFSQLAEEPSGSGHEHLLENSATLNEDIEELEGELEGGEEEESITDNYYILEHNYDGHPTFQVDETERSGRVVATTTTAAAGATTTTNCKTTEASNNQSSNRNPYRQQLLQQQQPTVCNLGQHVDDRTQPMNTATPSSKCNCNLVLYPL